jgi:hypothetical protein
MSVTKNYDSVRYQCRVPMFEVLAISHRVNGSKLAGWDEGRSPSKYNRRPKYVWMCELAARVVRRYRIPVAFSEKLEWRIQQKYGRSNSFNLPSPTCNIGLLQPMELIGGGWTVGATGMGHPVFGDGHAAVTQAALRRFNKMKMLLARKRHPEGDALTAWILTTELEGFLNGREKEARQQSRIWRQQGGSAAQHGGNDWALRSDHGACHQ